MGSKQALSNGNEPEELTDLVAAFEQHNQCKITLTCSLALHSGYLDLEWVAIAREKDAPDPVAIGSGLVSAREWGGGYKTLMGVASRLLYSLDFALAEKEFDKVIIK
jgi:hypothetical protein